jgi:hypothetical protein
MKNLVDSVYRCLNTQNWYGALMISLTLPDICGFSQYSNLSSGARYVKWFNQYLKSKYECQNLFTNESIIFLTGEDCYALRCSFLHEGSDEIVSQRARKILEKFIFTTTGLHCNYFDYNGVKMLQLDVDTFCKDICNAIGKWLEETSDIKEVNENLSGMLKIHIGGYKENGLYIG